MFLSLLGNFQFLMMCKRWKKKLFLKILNIFFTPPRGKNCNGKEIFLLQNFLNIFVWRYFGFSGKHFEESQKKQSKGIPQKFWGVFIFSFYLVIKGNYSLYCDGFSNIIGFWIIHNVFWNFHHRKSHLICT